MMMAVMMMVMLAALMLAQLPGCGPGAAAQARSAQGPGAPPGVAVAACATPASGCAISEHHRAPSCRAPPAARPGRP